MVIFKLLILSYMRTTLYYSFHHANSTAMLYVYLLHEYKKKLESTNVDLKHSSTLIFATFSLEGMVVQQFMKLENPFPVANLRRKMFGHT